MKNAVAILWDAENVNPNQKEDMIESILEYSKKYGQISVAAAFADWKKPNLGSADEVFAKQSFQLIHVPGARKNSADISLITSGIEYLFIYPHIDTYVLITGDIDFRPLLVSIRRRGCKTIVICDARNASEDLLQIADEYFDYRSILDEDNDEGEKILTKEKSYDLLKEAINSIKEKKGRAHYSEVKVRMLLLENKFNERDIGFSNWAGFVEAAKKDGIIRIENEDKNIYLDCMEKNPNESTHNDPFGRMLKELNILVESKTDKRILFTKLAETLSKKKIDIKQYGYGRFKKYMQDAEIRDLVKIESKGLIYSVFITDKGIKNCT